MAEARMQALVSERRGFGQGLVVGDLPVPSPGAREVRIRVHCAGINYPDALIVDDRYQVRPTRPFAPGIEVAGVIDSVGLGVRSLRPGQRCLALLRYGGIAGYAVAADHVVAAIDDDLDFVDAAAMVVSYGTAWHVLHDRAGLRAGETVLIPGASGTVGIAAVELAKALGATVVAAVSTEAKAAFVAGRGADRTLVYPPDEVDGRRLAELFRDACGGSADCVLDPVGGVYGEAAFRALGWGGRFLVTGFASALPSLPANLMLLKSMDVLGVSWGETVIRRPGMFRRHIRALARLKASGAIRPAPSKILPIEEARSAIEALSGRVAMGKAVVRLSEARP